MKEEEICSPTTTGPKNITVATYLYDETNRMVQGTNKAGEVSAYTFNGLGVRVGTELILEDNSHGYTDFRRLSQSKIGVISAPICAFYRHSFGEFSIVSVQSCPIFSRSGSKLGQTRCTRTHAVHGLYGLLSCLQRARWWR